MILNTVQCLFDAIMLKSEQHRIKNKNFDGKAYWKSIKQITEKTDWTADKWKPVSKDKYNAIMDITEFIINGHGEKNIIEENHFLIQTVRIPVDNKPTLKKIMQVALNIGQYEGYVHHTGNTKYCTTKMRPNLLTKFILKKDTMIKLDTILSKSDISYLEKLLE